MYFLLAALFYFSLVTGGAMPFVEVETNYIIAKTVCLITFACVSFAAMRSTKFVKASFIFSAIAVPILLFGAVKSSDALFAAQKFDSIVFGTLCSGAILYVMLRKIGEERAFDRIIAVGLCVLGATLLYKGNYGFWDRDVRFLLNGPIVFGWLMGAMCILSLVRLFSNGGRRYVLTITLFFAATLWTMSKGAILALCIAVFLLLLTYFFQRKISIARLVGIALVPLFLVTFLNIGDVVLENTRLSAFSRILTNETDRNDEGSIGTRLEMLNQSAEVIRKHYLGGVGLGSWKMATGSEFSYPHNIYAEIAAEFGLPISLVILALLTAFLMMSPPHIRILALFFLIASGLSGDSSYLRFPLAFLLATLAARLVKNETKNFNLRSRNQVIGNRLKTRLSRVGSPHPT